MPYQLKELALLVSSYFESGSLGLILTTKLLLLVQPSSLSPRGITIKPAEHTNSLLCRGALGLLSASTLQRKHSGLLDTLSGGLFDACFVCLFKFLKGWVWRTSSLGLWGTWYSFPQIDFLSCSYQGLTISEGSKGWPFVFPSQAGAACKSRGMVLCVTGVSDAEQGDKRWRCLSGENESVSPLKVWGKNFKPFFDGEMV